MVLSLSHARHRVLNIDLHTETEEDETKKKPKTHTHRRFFFSSRSNLFSLYPSYKCRILIYLVVLVIVNP